MKLVDFAIVWVTYFTMSVVALRISFDNSWRQIIVCASLGATAAMVIVGLLHSFFF